jgi:hypothetical protein
VKDLTEALLREQNECTFCWIAQGTDDPRPRSFQGEALDGYFGAP